MDGPKIIDVTFEIINRINLVFDLLFLMGGLIFFLESPLYFYATNFKKFRANHKGGDLFSQTLFILFIAIIASLIWGVPELVISLWSKFRPDFNWAETWTERSWIFTALRLIGLAVALSITPKLLKLGPEESRWKSSYTIHLLVIAFGFIVDRLLGVLLISVPLLATYYAVLYALTLVTLPASNPEDRKERWNRFTVMTSYAWGIQAPIYVVDGHAWKKLEPRIIGDFTWEFSDLSMPFTNIFKRPGVVWTPAHQIAAITAGTHFKRVDGPGLIFTGKLERPEQIFDLRLQLRTNEIDVVSKDGISFKVRVFTAFRLDPETWDRDTYHKFLRMNLNLRGADKLSNTAGSFPYSAARVQVTLGMTSSKADTKDMLLYWDQRALNVVEDQARKVVSQKNLGELWRPAQDKKGANALNMIADEIKSNIQLEFRSVGILLFVARIVNFSFPASDGQTDEISQQQIKTWSSEWKRKSKKIQAEAEAEAERVQQEARAYAEALLLNSIAEGLQKTYDINPRLPRYVIAMRFLSALQEYVYKQSAGAKKASGEPEKDERISEYEKKLNDLHAYLKDWQNLFLSGSGKET